MALVKACRHPRDRWRRCGCAWYWDVRIDGRRRRINVGTEYAAARRRTAQLEADRLSGKVTAPRGGQDIGSLARRALAERPARARTVETRRYQLAVLDRYFGQVPVTEITTLDVRRFFTDLATRENPRTGRVMSTSYARGIRSILRAALDQAIDEGIIESVPMPATRPIRERSHSPERLDLDQVQALIAELRRYRPRFGPQPKVDWGDLAELVVLTGLRISELLGLRREAVDLERGTLRVVRQRHRGRAGEGPPKTEKSTRILSLSPRAVELLGPYVERTAPGEWVFPVTHDAARYAVKGALRRIGLERDRRAWHELRHAHSTLLDEAHITVRATAARMGHGAHFAQTAAYGSSAELDDVGGIDAAWDRH